MSYQPPQPPSAPPLTPQEFQATLHTTDTFAGGFFRSLAAALRRADPSNRVRLLAAFPEIVSTYGPGSTFYRQWCDTQARQRVEGLSELFLQQGAAPHSAGVAP